MNASTAHLAEAFSRHRFDEVYAHLAEDVWWDLVGERRIEGRAAVIATCRESAAHLATVTTTFERFVIVADETAAAVDARATYTDAASTFRVASCDIYEFTGDRLAGITSYTTEL